MSLIKQDRLRHAVEKFEEAHGQIELRPGDAIEQTVWAILARHGSREKANRAFSGLRHFFVDINELRVAKATDIAEAVRDHVQGDAISVAEKIRGFLRKIYDDRNVLGFDFGREMDRESLRRYLAALPGFAPELALGVLLKLRTDEKELVPDSNAARVAARIGAVPAGTGAPRFKRALEEEVTDPAHAVRALFALATHAGAVCHAKSPDCGACVLGEWCPSYAAPRRKEDGKAPPARRGGEKATPRTTRARSRSAAGKKSSRR
ncbi:MAG: hypothetical protein ACREID_07195 [Planctomycetota bacterium]